MIQEITRNKAALQAQKECIEDFVSEPFVQLDESMVILHVDITFEDYNVAVQNNRYQANVNNYYAAENAMVSQ